MSSKFSDPRVLKRFIILMVCLMVAVGLVSVFMQYVKPPAGDFEVRQGDILLQDGEYEAAIRAFDEALAKQPNHRGALHGKATAFIALERYEEAEAELTHLIDFLQRNLEPDDPTGVGALSAAFANRGIIRDRQGRYEEALADYVEAIKIDYDLAEGPGWLDRLLYHDRAPSSVVKRAEYLYKQLQLPEGERLMRVPEIDAEQRTYKP